jgi:GrpB-like predicted nucleotidyltransferase (UPF0157 family)
MRFICEHRTDWAAKFAELSCFIFKGLTVPCTIHHIGSTSIPGMPAKDIIDIDVECGTGAFAQVARDLISLGYEHEGDLGIPTREAFGQIREPAISNPKHHLYVCESHSPELARHLAFKHYLIMNPARAAWLAAEKKECDEKASSRDDYSQRKSDAYQTVLVEAMRNQRG